MIQKKSHTQFLSASEEHSTFAKSFVYRKVVDSQEKSHKVSSGEWSVYSSWKILCFPQVDSQVKSQTISLGEWRVCCTCKILSFPEGRWFTRKVTQFPWASEEHPALAKSFVSLKVVDSQEKSHTISFGEWRASCTYEILCFLKGCLFTRKVTHNFLMEEKSVQHLQNHLFPKSWFTKKVTHNFVWPAKSILHLRNPSFP